MAEVKEAAKPKTGDGDGHAQAKAKEKAGTTAVVAKSESATPFAFIRRFAEEMDQLFEDFGVESRWRMPSFLTRGHELLRREAGFIPAKWSPRVDVVEREGRFVVRADLPGLSKDDVKVEISDHLLTIHGERKEEKKEEREGCRYSECSYGNFYRAIPLPEGVEASKASADFRQGVLEVSMPSTAAAAQKPRRIEVQEKK